MQIASGARHGGGRPDPMKPGWHVGKGVCSSTHKNTYFAGMGEFVVWGWFWIGSKKRLALICGVLGDFWYPAMGEVICVRCRGANAFSGGCRFFDGVAFG